jgi:hypothetical protein
MRKMWCVVGESFGATQSSAGHFVVPELMPERSERPSESVCRDFTSHCPAKFTW